MFNMEKIKKFLPTIILIVAVVVIFILAKGWDNNSKQSNNNINETPSMKTYTQVPSMIIDINKLYSAIMKTTAGDMEIQLNVKETPITVNNFVFLARDGYYNNVIFHRVIPGFMIQGGDPTGVGSGGPGYHFPDEAFAGEYERGTMAMANAGPNTNGSQFFIMHQDYPLDKAYVIFGKVIKGLEVIDKIATAKTKLGSDGAMSSPIDPVKILSIEIIEK
jgi:cyclophilin family peptidyl-prolyl cis-trans isomerase